MERRQGIKLASIKRQNYRIAAKRKLNETEIEELPSDLSNKKLEKMQKVELVIDANGKLSLDAINKSTKEDLLKKLPSTVCLVKRRPTDQTFKKYVEQVLYTRRLIGKTFGYDFLLETEIVIDAVTKNYPLVSSRCTTMASLTSFCGRIAGLEIPYKAYSSLMIELNSSLKKDLAKNTFTDRQKLTWISWVEIMSLLPAIVTMSSRDQLIFALYTDIPPRRLGDFLDLLVYISDNEIVDLANIPEEKNYIVCNSFLEPVGISIANYKTKNTYGTFRHIISKPSQLYLSIVRFIGSNPVHGAIVFANRYNTFYEKSVFSWIIGNIFEKATLQILGKAVRATVNTLRHSFITNMIEKNHFKTVEQRIQIGFQMGHSFNQQSLYAKYTDVE